MCLGGAQNFSGPDWALGSPKKWTVWKEAEETWRFFMADNPGIIEADLMEAERAVDRG